MNGYFLHHIQILASFPLLSGNAYLDPGSGSVLIQLLIAGLLGAAFVLKVSWKRIKAFFTRSQVPEDEKPEDE
jgi:hypothetical protein